MEIWELTAKNQALLYSATTEGYSQFHEAFNTHYIGIGLGIGMTLFAILKAFGAPIFLLYGLIQGLNQTLPHSVIPQFLGALLGRRLAGQPPFQG